MSELLIRTRGMDIEMGLSFEQLGIIYEYPDLCNLWKILYIIAWSLGLFCQYSQYRARDEG